MQTNDELKTSKDEVEAMNGKLNELSEDELKQVSGGAETVQAKYSKGYTYNTKLYNKRVQGVTVLKYLPDQNKYVVGIRFVAGMKESPKTAMITEEQIDYREYILEKDYYDYRRYL